MDNYQVADIFSMLAKLMDIHGENSFKAKSYASAAFSIEKLPVQLTEIPTEKISTLKGIGASSAQKIVELLQTGHLKQLEEIIFLTPPGVLEMLNIKGIGPKKINTIWKEMEIESVGELLYACKENRLKLYKGFGEKTQQSIIDTIEFYLKSKGSHLYSQVVLIVSQMEKFLSSLFDKNQLLVSGAFLRQLEVIDELEFVIDADEKTIENKLNEVEGFNFIEKNIDCLLYETSTGINFKIYPATEENLIETLVQTSSSETFFKELNKLEKKVSPAKTVSTGIMDQEENFFASFGLEKIPAPLRESAEILLLARNKLPGYIREGDIRGIIHCHSNWSDGSNSIEELALAAIERGLEYLAISDHSKSAFYANGLSEERIVQQHVYIDELNKKLAPFRIYKSIESDILNDGSLDYPSHVLSTFELVITSVHSNLKMTEEKAMARLLKAIENPYTTILGHMTGRLLLSRHGYPVDHKRIIDACAANNVVIELNAHP
ncbi:MAG TPA: helix-hairpin-helix domain-containing protein, partial [Ferruginibacter sp.]|nr:helix-hairpin-helix domain-containing protein [Ferruginibacter sp.]